MSDHCVKIAALNNTAKVLKGFMEATGIYDSRTLSERLCIPIRTIQRLKLDIACAMDGAYSGNGQSATSATDGAYAHANSAMDGVSGAAKCATDGASNKKESPPIPPKEKTTLPRTTVEQASKPCARDPEEGLAGLDDLAEEMLAKVERWMPQGDRQAATNWLRTTVKHFGQDVTRRAYVALVTDIASGSVIANKLKMFSAIANRIKAEPPPKPKPRKLTCDEQYEAAMKYWADQGITIGAPANGPR